MALTFAFLDTLFANGVYAVLLVTIIGASLASVGLHLAMRAKWQSEILRIRVLPQATRPSTDAILSNINRLPVGVFVGRVRSDSSSSNAGTYRSLGSQVAGFAFDQEVGEVIAQLRAAAKNANPEEGTLSKKPLSLAVPSTVPASSNLIPLDSESPRPTWYAHRKGYPQIPLMISMVAMIVLTFGGIWGTLPSDQTVVVTSIHPSISSLPPQDWSPRGSVSGTLFWNTWNASSQNEVRGPTITVAVCPSNVGTSVVASTCKVASGSPFTGAPVAGISLDVPSGWHIAVISSGECQNCTTRVTWSYSDLGLLVESMIAGGATVAVAVILRARERKQTRSQWPPSPSTVLT